MKRLERNRLDKLWKELVKKRAKYRCEVCGRSRADYQLHSHHILGRKNLQVRWDLENGVCLCALCHKLGKRSAHENPLWFLDWVKNKRNLNYLRKKSNGYIKLFYDEIKSYLDNFNLNYETE